MKDSFKGWDAARTPRATAKMAKSGVLPSGSTVSVSTESVSG